MADFNYVDLAVFGLFFLSAVIGIARGFTREFFGITAWVGAILATLYGIVTLRPIVQDYIESPFVADVVTGITIFILVLFILGSISRYLSSRIKGSVLGGLDRSMGLLFGLARAVVIVVVTYFLASVIYPMKKWPEIVKEARVVPYVMQGSDWLKEHAPSWIDDAIKNLGLKPDNKEKELEEAALDQSLDHIVQALSHPTPEFTSSDYETDAGEPDYE